MEQLVALLATIPGIEGVGWEREPEYPFVWIVASVPGAAVERQVYKVTGDIRRAFLSIRWEFLLVASDDPDMSDTWGRDLPPRYQPVPHAEHA